MIGVTPLERVAGFPMGGNSGAVRVGSQKEATLLGGGDKGYKQGRACKGVIRRREFYPFGPSLGRDGGLEEAVHLETTRHVEGQGFLRGRRGL